MCVLIQAGNASGRTFPREQGWGGGGAGRGSLITLPWIQFEFFFLTLDIYLFMY